MIQGCENHFKSDDFEVPVPSLPAYTGRMNRRLKNSIVPSIFTFLALIAQSVDLQKKRWEARNRRQNAKEAAVELPLEVNEAEVDPVIALETFFEWATNFGQEIEVDVGKSRSEEESLGHIQTMKSRGTETEQVGPLPLFSLERFKDNAKAIQFYTSFQDYNHFLYVFQCLRPAAHHLANKSQKLDNKDEFSSS